jgi:phi13 family phage major tail protein
MGYKMNVKNCKYAPVSVDTNSTYTLGTAVDLPAIRTVDVAFTLASGELYGDGALVSKMAKLTGATLKLGIDKLPQAARAAMLGHTINAKGVMSVKVTDVPIKIAMYMEIELDDGGYEALWLLVGKAEPVNITGNQSETSINYTTDELTVDFVRREKDKQVIAYADTDNDAFDSAAQTAFKASPDITT